MRRCVCVCECACVGVCVCVCVCQRCIHGAGNGCIEAPLARLIRADMGTRPAKQAYRAELRPHLGSSGLSEGLVC